MAITYSLIEAKTLGSATASVTFTSIPQTYTDLLLKVSARSDEAGGTAQSTSLSFSINGVTTNRTFLYLTAFGGTTVESFSTTGGTIGTTPGTAATASTFNNTEIYLPNYTSSNNKSFSVDAVTENNSSTNNSLRLTAGLWSQTAAITSLGFTSGAGNFVQYSTFYLYGIKNS